MDSSGIGSTPLNTPVRLCCFYYDSRNHSNLLQFLKLRRDSGLIDRIVPWAGSPRNTGYPAYGARGRTINEASPATVVHSRFASRVDRHYFCATSGVRQQLLVSPGAPWRKTVVRRTVAAADRRSICTRSCSAVVTSEFTAKTHRACRYYSFLLVCLFRHRPARVAA